MRGKQTNLPLPSLSVRGDFNRFEGGRQGERKGGGRDFFNRALCRDSEKEV
jgi:hypothetical protein